MAHSRYRGSPKDLLDYIVDLQKRVRALESGPQAAFTSIGRGGLDILDGGSIRIHNGTGDTVLQLGQLASGGFGLETIDPVTGETVDLNALTFGASSASVIALEATSSTTPTDLTTHGPAVDVTIGSSGRALVTLSTYFQFFGPSSGFMTFQITGATNPPIDLHFSVGLSSGQASDLDGQLGSVFLVTGLNAGLHTFTAKYLVAAAGNTCNFGSYRNITVQPF